MWTQESLYRYCSPSYPDFTFYYMPLPRYQQKNYRKGYHKFSSTKDFMANLLRLRLIVMEESINGAVYRYALPAEEDVQDQLLKRIPKELLIEVGAVVLGWMRAGDEEPEVFMDRVVCDLKDATS